MKLKRFPVLLEGGSSLDWLEASYMAKVDIIGSQAMVVHQLDGAPQLDRLVESGEAQWITEFRCPRTLLSRETRSSERTQRIVWNEEETIDQMFLVPGLVAVAELVLDPSGLNPFGWLSSISVEVPSGWWLARAQARRVKPLVASLVRFRRDTNLECGRMAVNEVTEGGNPYFVVKMASDLYEKRKDCRDIQIAGLIGACARLPYSSMGRDTQGQDREHHDHALAQELRHRFEKAQVADWTSDQFDPAQAATLLEAFHVPAVGEVE
ncbi:MAG: hypothetical protein F4138_00445 [Acidimicrobiia bacterium]|nr:hypothetical protein [Acidimicrobiia bacterium]MYC57773.1 hypothetical protein [Acidimicrobiia bacterium]MYG93456.1 hypothetical protein [Acidimicrobiia bacterium]MYI31322.1 hypothetical protein [Acidimicrobiia bacterium]